MLSCWFSYLGRLLETKQKMGVATLITEACIEISGINKNVNCIVMQHNFYSGELPKCVLHISSNYRIVVA